MRAVPFRSAAGGALALMLIWGAPAQAEDESRGPPFAERKKPPPPKPAQRAWSVIQKADKTFLFDFSFQPGIPDPGQVTEIIINVNEEPKKAHPQFGRRIPQEDARMVVELTSPAGEVVGRYLAHAIPLSRGKYGLHLTPSQEGIYTLTLRGKSKDGDELSAELKLPVAVWPLPPELEGTGEAHKTARRGPIKL